MDAAHRETYKGHGIEIWQEIDQEIFDPREQTNTGIMACFHRRYTLGDKHDHKADDFGGWADFEKHLREEHGALVIAPLFLYDHSGLRMKIGSFAGLLPQGHAEFDSGQVGFIYATRETIDAVHGKGKLTKKLRALVTENLEGEVKDYDCWLSGDIWGFSVKGPTPPPCKTCGHVAAPEVLESCGGFFGNTEAQYGGALAEARRVVDALTAKPKSKAL